MKRYFITASGTGMGKTLVTCALAHQLKAAGSVRALKPVISGFDANDWSKSDTALLLQAQRLDAFQLDRISPWRFKAPLSPDMAAADEGRVIDFEKLVEFCKEQVGVDSLLIEGVGGVMVPLTNIHTVLDWAAALAFPVILVTGSYLGALSHTLTAAHAVTAAGLTLHAVIVSESEISPAPLLRVRTSLERFLPQKTHVLCIDRLDSSHELWKDVPNMLYSL